MLLILGAIGYVLSLFIAAFGGYQWRGMVLQLKQVKASLEAVRKRQPELPRPKPTATLLDPDDVVARAKWEHEDRLKRLSGKDMP